MALGRRAHTRIVSVVVVVIVGAGLVVPSPGVAATPATTWSLGDDFRFSPNQLNPSLDTHGNNDVWHYMEASGTAHNPASYSLLPTFATNWGGLGIQGWTHGVDQVPYVLVNPSNRQAATHVGNAQNVVVGWKSPITGTVYVSGRVRDEDATGTGVLWSVDNGSTTIASGSIAPGGEQLFSAGTGGSVLNTTGVAVAAGDFLYFIVDPNVQAGCTPNCGNFDGNQIAVTISDQPIPGVHRWRANGNANDSIGTNHGTLTNGATAAGAPAEGTASFSLDGVNDFVEMPDVASHYFSGSFTVDVQVNTSDATGLSYVVSKNECGGSCPSGVANSHYRLGVADGFPYGFVHDSDAGGPGSEEGQGVTGSTFIADGTFHRLRFVRDVDADLLAVYVDGAVAALETLDPEVAGPLTNDDGEADPLRLGVEFNPTAGNYFQGLVDDVQLSAEGTVAPADFAPTPDDTDPNSPADDNSPEIKGTAVPGSTVNLYTNSTCTGSPIATGDASIFSSPGLTPDTPLPDDSTTTFYATATVGTAVSSCSTDSITYVEQTSVPDLVDVLQVIKGKNQIGGLSEIQNDDAAVLALKSKRRGDKRIIKWEGHFTQLPSSLDSFTLHYEGTTTRPVARKVLLFNPATGKFECVGTCVLAKGQSTINISGSNLAQYVHGSEDTVRVRVQSKSRRGYTETSDQLLLSYES